MVENLNIERSGMPADAWDMDLPQMPVEVHGCFCATDTRSIYVVGGTSGKGHTDVIQTFDIRKKRWRTASALPWQGRLMVGGLLDCGLVTVFGGTYCVYDTDTKRMEAPVPLRVLKPYRNAGKGVILGDRLIVLGGTWAEGAPDRFSAQAVELDHYRLVFLHKPYKPKEKRNEHPGLYSG